MSVSKYDLTPVLLPHISAGSMGDEPEPAVVERGMGILGCLDTKGVWRESLDNIDISNGLAWTKDAKTMFYIDSIPRKVYAFDFDNENGTICKWWVVTFCVINPLNHNK